MNLGTMSNTEQNPVGEFFVNLLRAGQGGLNAIPMEYSTYGMLTGNDPKLGDIALEGMTDYAEDISYGGSLGTGTGEAWNLDPRALELMDLVGLGGFGAKGAAKQAFKHRGDIADYAMTSLDDISNRLTGAPGIPYQNNAIVYQGGKVPYDKLDAEKIGTGTSGAQHFGWGHNIAGRKAYAERFKGNPDGVEIPGLSDEINEHLTREFHESDFPTAKDIDSDWINSQANFYDKEGYPELAEQLRKADYNTIRKTEGHEGYLTELDLDDKAISEMMDWNTPMSEQPQSVQDIFEDMYNPDQYSANDFELRLQDLIDDDATGQELYYEMIDSGMSMKEASEQLQRSGIPGISYSEGGSTALNQGTNYTLFPGGEDLAKPISRNGISLGEIAGPMPPNNPLPEKGSYLSLEEFDTLGRDLEKTSDVSVRGVHNIRGKLGYAGGEGPSYHNKFDIAQLMNKYEQAVKDGDLSLQDELNEELHELNIGSTTLTDLLKGSETVLDKPFYVKRAEGAFTGQKDPKRDVTLSASAIDPSNPSTYKEGYSYTDDKGLYDRVFKLDKGQEIYHPMGQADADEVIIMKDQLKKAKSINRKKFIEMMKKGIDPLSVVQQMQSAQYA